MSYDNNGDFNFKEDLDLGKETIPTAQVEEPSAEQKPSEESAPSNSSSQEKAKSGNSPDFIRTVSKPERLRQSSKTILFFPPVC